MTQVIWAFKIDRFTIILIHFLKYTNKYLNNDITPKIEKTDNNNS